MNEWSRWQVDVDEEDRFRDDTDGELEPHLRDPRDESTYDPATLQRIKELEAHGYTVYESEAEMFTVETLDECEQRLNEWMDRQ